MKEKARTGIPAGICIIGAVLLLWHIVSVSNTTAPPRWTSLPHYEGPVAELPEEKLPFAHSRYRERETLFMSFHPEEVDLCCLGDSITAKFEWQDALYPLRVANRGIGSDTTAGIAARLDSIAAIHPSVVSLMAGINDLVNSSPDETAGSYAVLLDALDETLPGTTVIVSSVLPVTAAEGIGNDDIRRLNQQLEALCREHEFTYLDIHGAFAGEDGFLRAEYAFDNVHLTAEGYRLWLSYLIPALEGALGLQQVPS